MTRTDLLDRIAGADEVDSERAVGVRDDRRAGIWIDVLLERVDPVGILAVRLDVAARLDDQRVVFAEIYAMRASPCVVIEPPSSTMMVLASVVELIDAARMPCEFAVFVVMLPECATELPTPRRRMP